MHTPPIGHRVHPADLSLPPTIRVHVETVVLGAAAPAIEGSPVASLGS